MRMQYLCVCIHLLAVLQKGYCFWCHYCLANLTIGKTCENDFRDIQDCNFDTLQKVSDHFKMNWTLIPTCIKISLSGEKENIYYRKCTNKAEAEKCEQFISTYYLGRIKLDGPVTGKCHFCNTDGCNTAAISVIFSKLRYIVVIILLKFFNDYKFA